MGADVDKNWSSIVVGGDLNAVRFALKNEIPILFNRFPNFHSYEPLDRSKPDTLEDVWAECSYELFEKCLNPFTNLIESIRVAPDDSHITVRTKNNNIFQIKYEKLFLFYLDNVFGLEQYFSREIVKYRILDWFDTRSLGDLEERELELDDHFINSVRFFESCRIDGNTNHKDIVCESVLTPEQLNDYRFSDTMARFKTIDILKKHGSPDISLSFWKRDVYPIYKTNYKELDSIFWRGI